MLVRKDINVTGGIFKFVGVVSCIADFFTLVIEVSGTLSARMFGPANRKRRWKTGE